ncbi:hypothetical protein WJX73_007411 [Symbiochloris irregularis]|uniref:F-box domain-containing protein n=1 Tax=Symbiochloris irregularis TaxID=706552 RepID=A0AAW1NWM4_9CHLO
MGTFLSNELVDIVSLHVCAKLRPCDIQTLERTCTALRRLILNLPASTWEAVAASTFPFAASPWRLLSGSEVCDQLERVAHAKSRLPEPTFLSIWDGPNNRHNTASAINYQGTQIITFKGGAISVYELKLDDGPPSLSPLLTNASVAAGEASKLTITWSPSGTSAAIAFVVRDTNHPGTEGTDGCRLG